MRLLPPPNRCNVRVSGVYLSQADSLFLLDHPQETIKGLAEQMRPDFEFGKTPTSFPEKVYERFDKAAEAAFERVSKQKQEHGSRDGGGA